MGIDVAMVVGVGLMLFSLVVQDTGLLIAGSILYGAEIIAGACAKRSEANRQKNNSSNTVVRQCRILRARE